MAMGIVSNSDFDSEMGKLNPSDAKPELVKKEVEIIDINRGRGNGNVEVPNALRKLIGEESVINGRQSAVELAKSFGLSPSSVSAYANGSTSTASFDETPNKPHLDSSKERIAKKARHKLMSAIQHITKDKLQVTSAKELAGIAKDMSAVVRTMEPEVKGPANVNNGPTFVFYSPQQKNEEAYDIVFAKE